MSGTRPRDATNCCLLFSPLSRFRIDFYAVRTDTRANYDCNAIATQRFVEASQQKDVAGRFLSGVCRTFPATFA